MAECLNCSQEAAGTYALVFERGVTLRDRRLCRDCRDFFGGSRAVEVFQAPVAMRGGEVVEVEEE